MAAKTPWGEAQQATPFNNDCVQYETAGHGGFWLSPRRTEDLRAIWPEAFGAVIGAGIPGEGDCSWWEEDCAVAFVIATWPGWFVERFGRSSEFAELCALRSVARWAPKAMGASHHARLEWLEAAPVEAWR